MFASFFLIFDKVSQQFYIILISRSSSARVVSVVFNWTIFIPFYLSALFIPNSIPIIFARIRWGSFLLVDFHDKLDALFWKIFIRMQFCVESDTIFLRMPWTVSVVEWRWAVSILAVTAPSFEHMTESPKIFIQKPFEVSCYLCTFIVVHVFILVTKTKLMSLDVIG